MAESLFMLDTNTVSYLIRNQSDVLKAQLSHVPMEQVCVSVITEAELLLGVAKKPDAKHLPLLVKEFLQRVKVLPWDSRAAECYAELRSMLEQAGKPLGSMDMLIAAHAASVDAVLITNDKTFSQVGQRLQLADWTKKSS